jgi:hypothetical protein
VGRHTDQDEDPGPDNGPDAQTRQLYRTKHATEPLLAVNFIEQGLQRLAHEQVRQQNSPQAAV